MSDFDDMPEADKDLISERWGMAALVIGFNELAKMQNTLAGKAFCRLMRAQSEKRLRELGHEFEITNKASMFSLPMSVPGIEFLPSDIELMRQCVAEHDAKAGK